jgi:hypothetical protein
MSGMKTQLPKLNLKTYIFIFKTMRNNKQSSIDWLVEKMLTQDWYTYKSLEYIKQAKAMHKEEMVNSILDNRNITSQVTFKDAVQYYNEKFNNEQ